MLSGKDRHAGCLNLTIQIASSRMLILCLLEGTPFGIPVKFIGLFAIYWISHSHYFSSIPIAYFLVDIYCIIYYMQIYSFYLNRVYELLHFNHSLIQTFNTIEWNKTFLHPPQTIQNGFFCSGSSWGGGHGRRANLFVCCASYLVVV